MTRSVRFLLLSLLPYVGIAWGIGLGLFALCWGMGGPTAFVGTYYRGFPMMCLMLPLVCFVGHGSFMAQISLSMGETRRSYARAVLALVPVNALAFLIPAWAVSELPRWLGLGWEEPMFITTQTLPLFLVSALCAAAFAPLMGLVLTRSRALGAVLITVLTMALMGGVLFLTVIGKLGSLHLWGDLPAIMMGAMGALTVASLVAVWKLMQTVIVR